MRFRKLASTTAVCIAVMVCHSAIAGNITLPSAPISEIRIEAINPWNETIANLMSIDLDKAFGSEAAHLMIRSTDPEAVASACAIIAAADFTSTGKGDGELDLRYRVTVTGSKGSRVLYTNAVGDVLQGGKVLRHPQKENWLLKVWNVIMAPHGLSYAPLDRP